MFLGASSWVFSWAPPYEESIKTISRLGLKGVELTIWNEEFMNEYYTEEKNKELKQLIADEGLVLTNVFCLPGSQSSPDREVRLKGLENFKKAVSIAKQLGTSQLTTCVTCPFELQFPFEQLRPTTQTWTLDVPKGLDWKQNYADFIETMKLYAEVCEENDVRLSIEPHPHFYIKNAEGLLRMTEKVGSDRIGINFDPSHLFPMGEIPQVAVYQMQDHIMHTHFSDNDAQSNAHWRPGKGKIDWDATVRALDDIGYNGVISLELEDVPGAAGYPGFHRDPNSNAELIEKEYRLAIEYMEKVFEREGIELEK
jgi:sugar phosphate isomerase/epimerase